MNELFISDTKDPYHNTNKYNDSQIDFTTNTFKHIGLSPEESLIESRTGADTSAMTATTENVTESELENDPNSLLGMWKEVNSMYTDPPNVNIGQRVPDKRQSEIFSDANISAIEVESVGGLSEEASAHVQEVRLPGPPGGGSKNHSSAPGGGNKNQTLGSGGVERSGTTRIPVPGKPFR